MLKNEASARHVHSVLAAAMADPVLLERWRHSPTTRKKAGAGAAGLDIDRVWRFSGLATKVRYNDVRLSLPFTLQLLDHAGISIEVFANYARQAAAVRRAGKNSRVEKIVALFDFLDGWLDRENSVHALIWDMVRHERAILQLQELAGTRSAGADAVMDQPVTVESVPARPDCVFHHEMTCYPFELARMLRGGRDVASIQRGRYCFAYCLGDSDTRIRSLEIDKFGFVLLDVADGNRTVSAIAAILRAAGVSLAAEDLCSPVQELTAHGLLTIAGCPRA